MCSDLSSFLSVKHWLPFLESFAQHSRAPTAPSDSLDSPEESPIAEYKKPKFWVPETQLPEDLNAVSDSLDTAEISDSQIAMDELTEIPESPEVPNSPDIQFMSDQPTMSQPVVGDK